jgi:hypothetical protein
MAALAKIMVVGHVRYLQFRCLERPMSGSKKSRRVRTWSTWRERERAKKNKETRGIQIKTKKIFSEMNIRISEDSHVASPPTATVIPVVAGPEPGRPLASVTGTWRTWRAVPSVTWGLEGSLGISRALGGWLCYKYGS